MAATSGDEPRLVRYDTPSAFLRAALPFDTWHMNIALGTSLQFFVEVGDAKAQPGQPRLWVAVWTGDELDIVLVRTSTMVTLCTPKHSSSLSPEWLAPRMKLLANSLHSLISSGAQPAMTSVTGATLLTSAFTPLYAAISGISPDGPAILDTLHTHCPRDRVNLHPPPLPEGHAIYVVEPGDTNALSHLAKLVQEFRAHHSGPGAYITLEQAAQYAEVGIRFREFMVYSIRDAEGKEEYAGYVRDGRIISKHAAIRNVFTLPSYRRQGIAQALTQAAVVRLLSEPNRMNHVLAKLLPAGAETAIDDAQIFAEKSNLSAQGIYSRVGYGFPVGEWDEEDGKSWEDCVELGYPGNTGH
ncbi:hypothetical protein CALCODRAFT_518605 [Calocera cornea HHB12733]|uniref:N-acetyltransferase domain-containing protein n=1 Tax=Calocera cornea HHB12733 TaxID=1353952 RepID=A0A165EXB7_9BASI|nr:hypothetical protein CALCODRAFT_518605 [Calocera cornea HHB12733]